MDAQYDTNPYSCEEGDWIYLAKLRNKWRVVSTTVNCGLYTGWEFLV